MFGAAPGSRFSPHLRTRDPFPVPIFSAPFSGAKRSPIQRLRDRAGRGIVVAMMVKVIEDLRELNDALLEAGVQPITHRDAARERRELYRIWQRTGRYMGSTLDPGFDEVD